MSLRFTIFAALIVASSSANASYRTSVDDDGCWDARDASRDPCLGIKVHNWSQSKITVTYKNSCAHRIYARVCHKQEDGGEDCGAFGIKAESTYSYYTYQATGNVEYRAVGSTNSSQDWVCASRWRLRD